MEEEAIEPRRFHSISLAEVFFRVTGKALLTFELQESNLGLQRYLRCIIFSYNF